MIAIVTDSTAGFSKKECLSFGIRIVPQTFFSDGNEYKETYADSFDDYTELINSKKTSLSTLEPSADVFTENFEYLLSKGYSIICITISSKLSGAYYNAVIAKNRIGSQKIEVIDSYLTAGGVYLLAKRARFLALTKKSLSETVMGVRKMISSIQVRFFTDDIRLLKETHRLTPSQKSLSNILNKKPILRISGGRIVAEDVSPGYSEGVPARIMFGGVPRNASNIIVHYVKKTSFTDRIATLAKRVFPDAVVEYRQLGPVLGVYLGDHAAGLVWRA